MPAQCAAKEKDGLPLLFHEDFKSGDEALKRFTFTDKEAWKIVQADVNGTKQNVLSLFKQSNYKPPVRLAGEHRVDQRHQGVALRARGQMSDHERADSAPGSLFFFAGVDASHMFYCHVAQQEDKIHNQIHIVDGKDRAR